jgi:phosphatidylethanolamine/phosphatidyl-N-methylethanolamine N-methyltransferase
MAARIDEVAGVGRHASASGPRAPLRAAWWTFLLQWLKNPLRVSSVTPSGHQLASMMANAMPANACRVVELGAGTGAITGALLGRGVAPANLLIVEMNAVLHDLLRRSFPLAQVVCGDATQLETMVAGSHAFAARPVDAVVSSLGLLAMPKSVQHDILAAAFAVLRPGGVFVQYTYGLSMPLADEVREQLGLRCERIGCAWRNLPPARVFVYRRAGEPARADASRAV